VDVGESSAQRLDGGHEEHERRQLLDLLSVAVAVPAPDQPRSDVVRLLGLLSDLNAGTEDVAAKWLRDALLDHR
jgi:hypothetical protein